MNGKGSRPRPTNLEKFRANWSAIRWGKDFKHGPARRGLAWPGAARQGKERHTRDTRAGNRVNNL
jgi:hypothetical protein